MESLTAKEIKNVVLPLFDGKDENFQDWWTKFKAYAGVYGFAKAIKTEPEANLPEVEDDDLDPKDENNKPAIMAMKWNALAMASLTMAFKSNGLMSMVYKSQTNDWPSGQAYVVIRWLLKKYRP